MAWLNALSALGGAAGGVVEGEQAKQQRELQKAQLEETRARTNQAVLTNIQNQIATNPELKTNPNYNKLMGAYEKKFGAIFPRNAQGNIDWDAVAPKQGGLERIKATTGLNPEQLKEMPSDQQKYFAKLYPDTAEFFGDFKQTVPLTPHSVDADESKVIGAVTQLGEGKISLEQFDRTVKFIAAGDPAIKAQADALIDGDQTALAKVGSDLQAKIDRYKALGILDKDKLKLDFARFKSIEDYRQFMETHFKEVDADRIMLDNERVQEDQKRDAREDERTSQSRQRLQMDLDKAKNGGAVNTPLGQLQKDAAATKSYVQVLQAQLASAQREAKMATDQGDDPSDVLTKHIEELKGKIQTQTDLLSNYTANQQALTQASLRASGVNVKTAPGAPGVATFHGRPAVATVKGQPIFLNDAGNGYVDAQGHPVK